MILSFEEAIYSKSFYLERPDDCTYLNDLQRCLTELGTEFITEPKIDDWSGEKNKWDSVTIPVQTVEVYDGISEFDVKKLLLTLDKGGFQYCVNINAYKSHGLTIEIRSKRECYAKWDD